MSRFNQPVAALAAALVLLTACGSGTTEPPPGGGDPGGITLVANTTITAVQQGVSVSITYIVTRHGSFTGPVMLTAEGLPNAVNAIYSPPTTEGTRTTTVITYTATTSAVPGRYDITIRARGAGVTDATIALDLTVTAAPQPNYQLSITGSPVTIEQGAIGQVTVTIARTGGFSGPVALTVEDAPAGMTANLDPSTTTGTSVTVTVIVSAAVVPNTYTLTVRGTSPALLDRTVMLQVVVVPATATGEVTLDFVGCGQPYAIWVAYQDGTGPWTRVTGTNLFRFSITAPTGAFAYVVRQSAAAATTTNVQFMTRAQMSRAPIQFCLPSELGPKIVTGTVAGMTGSQAAFLNLGRAFSMATPLASTFSIPGVLPGERDLIAYRLGGLPSTADRVIVRRDINLPSGGSLGTLDFGSTEAHPPATATFTVTGLAGEGMLETVRYLTRTSCDGGLMMYQSSPAAAAHAVFGIPSALQRPTDYHLVNLAAATPTTSRVIQVSFHTMANRTLALGGLLGAPAITVLPGGYKRLQAVFAMPVDYDHDVTLHYLQTGPGAPRLVNVIGTAAWAASTTVTLGLPDFSTVTGWTDSWAPTVSAATNWTITATGGDVGAPLCGEGVRTILASVKGAN